MNTESIRMLDCDGHVIESMSELAEYGDASIRWLAPGQKDVRRLPFPSLDGIHWHNNQRVEGNLKRKRTNASAYRMGSAEDWQAFLDKTGIEETVLFPSSGLGIGLLRDVEYTVSLCRAYNDYVAARYRRVDSRLHPMAIIPMQDPKLGAEELRRAVTDLDLPGAMVPATGLLMGADLGHPWHWPAYEAAAELDCVLGVHGGSNRQLGLDTFMAPGSSQTLHHPVALVTACVSMTYNGVFDRYPNLRVAFLEGGCAWVVLMLDRIERNREQFPVFHNWPIHDYLTSGRILVGCEGNDPSLAYLVERIGPDAFAYSSDYPHEVDLVAAQHEIEETIDSPKLTLDHKAAILGGNARRFFKLGHEALRQRTASAHGSAI